MSFGPDLPAGLTAEQEETLRFFIYSASEDLLIAKKDLRIPSASLKIEDLITLSEQTGFMSISNNVTGLQFTILDSLSLPSVGSFRPNQFFLKEAENNLILQPDLSVPIPTADFTFNITTTQEAQTNVINLMTSGAVNNVRIKITDTVTGIAFKYIPSRLAFDDGVGGLDLPSGVAPIDLEDSQLRFSPGRQLTIDVNADSTGILGNAGGIPWLSVDLQRAEFRSVGWLRDAESIKKDAAFVAENALTYLVDTSGGAVTVTITSDVNEFWIGDWETTWSNTDKVSVIVGVDTVELKSANKGEMFRFTRQGSVFRVYNGAGEFQAEANI